MASSASLSPPMSGMTMSVNSRRISGCLSIRSRASFALPAASTV